MRATPRKGHSLRVGFARALAEGRVIHLVIDLVDILRQAWSKAFKVTLPRFRRVPIAWTKPWGKRLYVK